MRKPLLLSGVAALLAVTGTASAQSCPGANGWVFDDVPASDPFCGYITWAAQNGITQGCAVIDAEHRLYCPDGDVVRSQMAAFLNRLADQPNSTSPTVGTIRKPEGAFLHNYGVASTFLGVGAGNFTMTGLLNTGVGQVTLEKVTSGGENTAVGVAALANVTTGSNNTAVGSLALPTTTTGSYNTAIGRGALGASETASFNTALGGQALTYNTKGMANTAGGTMSLFSNTTGSWNTSIGHYSLFASVSTDRNTAVGSSSLVSLVAGGDNVAIGVAAMQNTTDGYGNIAIGGLAGLDLTVGNENIYLGHYGAGPESLTMRLGSHQTRAFVAGVRGVTTNVNDAIAVVIDGNGQLGTISSSREGKDDIADMSDASAGLLQLRPVTFRYKDDRSPAGPRLQYGLIAEEVAQVYPGMVATKDGKPHTVMYHYLPPMLLNEYQRQQQAMAAQSAELHAQRGRIEALEAERIARGAEIAELRRAVEVLMSRTSPVPPMAAR